MSNEIDKDYSALIEDYEDALMRLVMYRVAQEDGKRLLQEAQELDISGFEVPKELDEKCLKLIRRAALLRSAARPLPWKRPLRSPPHIEGSGYMPL